MRFVGKTDTGITRYINQDYFSVVNDSLNKMESLAVLADGMGGTKGGEIASTNAVNSIIETIVNDESNLTLEELMKKAFNHANHIVFQLSRTDEELRRMGTTLVVAFYRNHHLTIGNIGDSRLYLIRDEDITKVTKDHSLVEHLIDEGTITREEAQNHPEKNVITRALGVDETIKVDIFTKDLLPNDHILLCSDGLTNVVSEAIIKDTILNHSLEEAVNILVDLANEAGGPDNITVILGSFDALN